MYTRVQSYIYTVYILYIYMCVRQYHVCLTCLRPQKNDSTVSQGAAGWLHDSGDLVKQTSRSVWKLDPSGALRNHGDAPLVYIAICIYIYIHIYVNIV